MAEKRRPDRFGAGQCLLDPFAVSRKAAATGKDNFAGNCRSELVFIQLWWHLVVIQLAGAIGSYLRGFQLPSEIGFK
jgi:hypothetical protein